MNEKLKALRERTNAAEKLSLELGELISAHWESYITAHSKRYGSMSDELIRELFDLGKAELIRRKEAELEALLSEPSAKSPQPDLAIGTIDTADVPGIGDGSDTWEQPCEPLVQFVN